MPAAAVKQPLIAREDAQSKLASIIFEAPHDVEPEIDARLPEPVARVIADRRRLAEQVGDISAPTLAGEPIATPHGAPTAWFLNAAFDQLTLNDALERVEAADPNEPFRYVTFLDAKRLDIVTREGAALARRYADAWMTLCASHGLALAVGDSTPATPTLWFMRAFLRSVAASGESVAVVGSDGPEMTRLMERYRFANLSWFNPPLNGRSATVGLHEAAAAVARANARYTLLCLGWPYDEAVAQICASRGYGRGVGLCIGETLDRIAYEPERLGRAPAGIGAGVRRLREASAAANSVLQELPETTALWRRSSRLQAQLSRTARRIARKRARAAKLAMS